MIDEDAFRLLRAEFVRRSGTEDVDASLAWREAVDLLDAAAQPRRVVLGVVQRATPEALGPDFPSRAHVTAVVDYEGRETRVDDPLRRWDVETPPGVLDEADHRDRVAQGPSRTVTTWRREPAGCWHKPETTSTTRPCDEHCGQSLVGLSAMGYRLRFADEPGAHR